MQKKHGRIVSIAAGATVAAALAGAQVSQAAQNPFAFTELAGGYRVADNASMEAKCGANKTVQDAGVDANKASQEAKCGANKAKPVEAAEAVGKTAAEAKCGEAKCGANKK